MDPAPLISGRQTPTGGSLARSPAARSGRLRSHGYLVALTPATSVTHKLTGAGASANAAYIGDSSWSTSTGTLSGVPKFGTLTFTNCLIDGKALASSHPHEYQRVHRVNNAGIVQIAPGALSSAGTAFTTYYNHS
jgi:hypothetical protein